MIDASALAEGMGATLYKDINVIPAF